MTDDGRAQALADIGRRMRTLMGVDDGFMVPEANVPPVGIQFCHTCGAVVFDEMQHRRFHEALMLNREYDPTLDGQATRHPLIRPVP